MANLTAIARRQPVAGMPWASSEMATGTEMSCDRFFASQICSFQEFHICICLHFWCLRATGAWSALRATYAPSYSGSFAAPILSCPTPGSAVPLSAKHHKHPRS